MTLQLCDLDRYQGISHLKQYATRMTSLLGTLEARADRHTALAEYKSIKENLRLDRDQLDKKQSGKTATKIEADYVLPAISKSLTCLKPATNTNPFSGQWHAAVYSARVEINHYLDQLGR